MATGPEHYANSERLIQLALDQWEAGSCYLATDITMPQAQIEATLALAAATAHALPSHDWGTTLSPVSDEPS